MKFEELVDAAADLHCFSPNMVSAGENIDQVRLQLSRWVRRGKVIRIHHGWYTLVARFRRARIDPFVVACTIKDGTYVSLESALSHHGLIPEHVAETTCVTTGRPMLMQTPLGRIRYRHINRRLFWGYREEPWNVQTAFVATPEKALLDLIYLVAGAHSQAYIEQLRLQNLEQLHFKTLEEMTLRFGRPKLAGIPECIETLRREDVEGSR